MPVLSDFDCAFLNFWFTICAPEFVASVALLIGLNCHHYMALNRNGDNQCYNVHTSQILTNSALFSVTFGPNTSSHLVYVESLHL